MNTEELTLVMDTLRALGGDGKTAFIWWLVFDKLLPTLATIAGIALLVFGIGRPFIGMAATDRFVRDLRDRLGIGSPGYITSSELQQIQQRINKMLQGGE